MIKKKCIRHGDLAQKDIYVRKNGKKNCRICERERGSRERAKKLLLEDSSLEKKDIPQSMVEVKRVLVQITKKGKRESISHDTIQKPYHLGIQEGIRYTLDAVLGFLPAQIASTVEQKTYEMLWKNYSADWDELPNGN